MGNKNTKFSNIHDQETLIKVVEEERKVIEEELNNLITETENDLNNALSDPNSIYKIKFKIKERNKKIILRSFIEGIKKAEDRLKENKYNSINHLKNIFENLFLISHNGTENELKSELSHLDKCLEVYIMKIINS